MIDKNDNENVAIRIDHRHLAGIVGGLAGSLCTYFPPSTVRRLLRHTFDDDQFWAYLESHYFKTGALREWEKIKKSP